MHPPPPELGPPASPPPPGAGRRRAELGRRQALSATAALLAADHARASSALPVRITTLELEGRPLVESAWLEAQWAEATRLFASAGVALELRPTRRLASANPEVATRADRDAFAAALEPRVINVFAVASLADVDEPGRMRKGVHWRPAARPGLHYVLVIAAAPFGVLAHELGHFFGLAHASARDNLMSYARSEGGALFLDRGQRARLLAAAPALAGELAGA